MIQNIGRPFCENGIALGISVCTQAEQHFTCIVNIHVVVHHHDVFGEHHLPHAPEAVHDFVGLHRVGLADAHEDEVVEDAFRRQRDVHDLGEVHLEDGQEEFHGRAVDVEASIGGLPTCLPAGRRDGRRLCGA